MIWNPLQKSNNRVLERHSGNVNSIAFTSDGQLLASADHSTVIIWCAKVISFLNLIRWVHTSLLFGDQYFRLGK